MNDPIDFDPALVSLWPVGGVPMRSGIEELELKQAADALMLETKAVNRPSPVGELQSLLNDMTAEMRRQFDLFCAIRKDAGERLASGDEAEAKIGKADAKAAADALSLIVRTLEKVDSLQRSLAHDRDVAAEQEFGEADYEAMLADIERRIDERAGERMRAWLAEREAAGERETGPPLAG